VDKIRWVGGQKMPILVHVQVKKCPRGGRYVVKKGQNNVHVFSYWIVLVKPKLFRILFVVHETPQPLFCYAIILGTLKAS
jgi:hypothetical protein